MKVFVAYGYNKRDEWIDEHVLPVVKAMTGEPPLTGRNLLGEKHAERILAIMDEADGFIAFLTRREGSEHKGKWGTHHYVLTEIGAAMKTPRVKRVLECREQDVEEQMNLSHGREPIRFNESTRLSCLARVVTAIADWSRELTAPPPMTLLLLPQEFSSEMKSDYRKGSVTGKYRIKRRDREEPEEWAKARAFTMGDSGLRCEIPRPPVGAEIEVRVEGVIGGSWTSSFTPVDALKVVLEKDSAS